MQRILQRHLIALLQVDLPVGDPMARPGTTQANQGVGAYAHHGLATVRGNSPPTSRTRKELNDTTDHRSSASDSGNP